LLSPTAPVVADDEEVELLLVNRTDFCCCCCCWEDKVVELVPLEFIDCFDGLFSGEDDDAAADASADCFSMSAKISPKNKNT